ncbi:MAG TPA: hypothetical protein VK147_13415 [Candidatus Didemnitutus sp.]|nr:hypothetical protein [Candidatus Didemnitutus sp.]
MKKWNWKKIIAISVGSFVLVVGIVAITYVLFSGAINESIRTAITQYVRTRITTGASNASQGKVEIELGKIDFAYYMGALDVHNIRIRYRDTSTRIGRLVDIDMPIVRVRGIFPWDILWGGGLSLSSVTITDPQVRYQVWGGSGVDTVVVTDTALVTLPHIPNVDSILHTLMVQALPTYAQPFHISAIDVVGLSFTNTDVDPDAMFTGEMTGLTVKLRNVSIDSLKPAQRPIDRFELSLEKWVRNYADDRSVLVTGLHILVSPTDSMLSVDSVAYHSPIAYTYQASDVVFSYRTKEITIRQFNLGPSQNDVEYFATKKYNNDRFRIKGTQLRLGAIDFAALTARTALHVKTVDLAKFDLDIASNKRLRSDPATEHPLMPNEIMATIPFSLSIDTIRVDSATILYGERWKHSVKPAELWWSGVKMMAVHLTNTPDQMERPFNVWARGVFVGQAMMEASFTIPLTSKVYTLTAKGALGKMNITHLNSFLPIADNLHISSGVARASSFAFTIRGRKCVGVVEPHFTNLQFNIVNKKTKKTGFFDGIASFLANWLVIKNDNDGDGYAPGKIRYTIPKDAAIMQTVWFPIRSGIKSAAGL